VSRHEDFENALWSDPDFLALTPEARMTYIWSWTNPRCGMAGLYKVALSQAALETGYTTTQIEQALAELAASDFAFYEHNVLFVRTRARRLRTKSEQIAKSIRSDLQKVADDHPLKRKFLGLYAAMPWLRPWIGEGRAGVDADSGEVHGGPPTKPPRASLSRSSTGSRSTPHGNGKGTGKGNGPQGRGAGRGAADWADWAAEHLPDLPAEFVSAMAERLDVAGHQVTAEDVRRLVVLRYPNVEEAA
jgi:hypothetical protein